MSEITGVLIYALIYVFYRSPCYFTKGSLLKILVSSFSSLQISGEKNEGFRLEFPHLIYVMSSPSFASGRSGGGLIQVRCETNSSPGAKIPIFPVNTIKMVGVFHGYVSFREGMIFCFRGGFLDGG